MPWEGARDMLAKHIEVCEITITHCYQEVLLLGAAGKFLNAYTRSTFEQRFPVTADVADGSGSSSSLRSDLRHMPLSGAHPTQTK